MKEAGIEIKEMNSGCICCSLVGDFGASLKEVMKTYTPDRILIEPSGVGKLSDVMRAVQNVIDENEVVLNSAVAVVDASKCKMYIKNFGEFFINQIAHAGTIILSRTGNISEEKLNTCISLIREHNEKATIITTPWDDLDGRDILSTIEGAKDLEAELMAEIMAHHEEEHDHHHHHDGEEHDHHHHDEEEHDHHHHGEEEHDHHHDGEEEHDHHHHGEEEHDHHHGEEEHDRHHHDEEGHDHHHHEDGHDHHDEHGHHHHHADEIFTSWGMETPAAYSKDEIEKILEALSHEETYGIVLRAKGMVPAKEGGWIYFDYVPEESNVREGRPDVTGKFCVIGSALKEDALKELFAQNNKEKQN